MPSLSLASSPSEVAAATMVVKATTELLPGPNWTVNMEICDFCNFAPSATKDVLKAVKKRLRQKNAKIQLLTLTLLETMVKNCGDHIHKHIGDRKLLDEMIKLVKKKSDVHVRDKILVLLDSWEEAFGGPGRQCSQYYWACDELRHCGIRFPLRARRSAPVITPTVSKPAKDTQVESCMQSNCSRRFEENMGSEDEYLSNSVLESMCNVVELLESVLETVNPKDNTSVRDEVITDLIHICRFNQKKLLKMLTVSRDENLLPWALKINYSMKNLLEKHEEMISGTYFSKGKDSPNAQESESVELNLKTGKIKGKSSASNVTVTRDEEEEEEQGDEISQLAERRSKALRPSSQSAPMGTTEDGASSSGSCSNALVLIDGPSPDSEPPVANTKEQDLIDLLSIVLTTSSTSSETIQAPNSSAPSDINIETSLKSYVVPWANTQQHQPVQSPHQFQFQHQNMQYFHYPQPQQTYFQSSSSLAPWELTGSNNFQNPNCMNNSPIPMQGMWTSQNGDFFQNPHYINQPMHHEVVNPSPPMQGIQLPQQANPFHTQSLISPSSMPIQAAQSSQNINLLSERASNGASLIDNVLMNSGSSFVSGAQKPYVPPYRLFEDLNVFSSSEGKLKSGPYPSASGHTNQNCVNRSRY